MGSSVGTRRDTLEALEFVARGVVKPTVQWAELGRMSELMEDVLKGKASWYSPLVCAGFVANYVTAGARKVRDKPRGYLNASKGGAGVWILLGYTVDGCILVHLCYRMCEAYER